MSKTILGIILLIVAIVIFLVSPFATIWAINTLFGMSIAFTVETWFAAAWISSIFGAITYSRNK